MSSAGVGYTCAVLVALVLVVAAITKARSPAPTARAFRRQGLPAPALLARAIPVIELATAIALVLVPTVGAAVALILLGAFTAFLVVQVRRGSEAPCACFGASRPGPISWADIAGNAFLIVASAVALLADTPTRPTPLDLLGVALLIGIDVAAQAVLRRARPAR